MKTRNELGILFQEKYKTGVGAEVGVRQGFFSKEISINWKGKIIGVDLWTSDNDYDFSKRILEGVNYEFKKGKSVDIAKEIPDESLDWVYIDANHGYDDIKSDYEAWYPKVRKGGILSGHDYGVNEFGVKKFIDELNIPFDLTTDDKWNKIDYQSWYLIK